MVSPTATEVLGISTHEMNDLVKELAQPIQGKADWRQYRCFQLLNNGITICCVHDSTSKTTAVATTVNVGAAYDPRSIPGLART
jgi:secreted Zn-dependent insulinase-like peptidase